ncbi:MAG: class I SAM-dependent methyltransferase [Waterburya sp.]
MNQLNLNDYKQEIADLYSQRSDKYDNSNWHWRIANRLVEYGQVNSGQRVLDIATGTGHCAFSAANLVGETGEVIGIDISPGMITQAQHKAKSLNLNNLEFLLADAETVDFPANYFDRIFCASAFIWMSDLVKSLLLWRKLLKPGGIIGIQAFAETAFVGGVVTQKIAEKYGISFLMSKPTGTVEKCRNLLEQANFKLIEIKVEQDGDYISFEQAKRMWSGNSHPAPGQYPPPLSQLSTEQLNLAQQEFENELKALQTDKGIWNDITTFYIYGHK